MTTTRITKPEFEPVTLAQAKAQCRVTHSFEDDLFEQIIIPGARAQAEHITKRSIMLQTWRHSRAAFPCTGLIQLYWPNLQAVTSIQYRDPAGAWQTLATDRYFVNPGAAPSVFPAISAEWPDTAPLPDSAHITYTAGYGAGTEDEQRAAVPANVKQWLLLRIGTAYKFREELVAGISVAELPGRYSISLLDGERILGF